MRPKSIRNSMENRYQKHARKRRAKIWKLIQKWSQNPSKITPKIDAKKNLEKSLIASARRNARGPQKLSFQKNPSEENREESRLKGENKVECKKWSAKGTYRKASAEREPTQDLNTLGGQRPRGDSLNAARGRNTAAPERMVPCEYGCGLWVVHG